MTSEIGAIQLWIPVDVIQGFYNNVTFGIFSILNFNDKIHNSIFDDFSTEPKPDVAFF